MGTSERLTEQEIMRCITDGGLIAGRHLAALERQKSALAAAERNAAFKANAAGRVAHPAKRPAPHVIRIRLSHWLGARLISTGHRLTGPTA